MRGECNVSCAYAVRGCTDPVASACCRSHLQTYHGIILFRAYESPEGRGDGKGDMDQPVQGPWHGHKGSAGAPLHQLVHDPETGEATGSCSLAEGFSFF